MVRFNTRPLEQSGDGGAKENKKWSGSIPGHWNVVEMEGIEPSSKQGSHTLSTCLFLPSVFVMQQDQDHQLHPYPLKFHQQSEASAGYPRLARELGHIYYASIRQRERNEFRQLIL